jgi:hypothetical protein
MLLLHLLLPFLGRKRRGGRGLKTKAVLILKPMTNGCSHLNRGCSLCSFWNSLCSRLFKTIKSGGCSIYNFLFNLILYMFLPCLISYSFGCDILLLLLFFFFFFFFLIIYLVYHHNDYIVYSLQIFSSLWHWGLGKLRPLKSCYGRVSVMREHFPRQMMRHFFIRNYVSGPTIITPHFLVLNYYIVKYFFVIKHAVNWA